MFYHDYTGHLWEVTIDFGLKGLKSDRETTKKKTMITEYSM